MKHLQPDPGTTHVSIQRALSIAGSITALDGVSKLESVEGTGHRDSKRQTIATYTMTDNTNRSEREILIQHHTMPQG